MSTQTGKGPGAADSPETRKRTAAEIEADLEAKRAELTQSVDALVDRIDPRTHVSGFVDDIKSGEPRAVSIVGGVAAGVVGLLGLAILRRNR